MVYRQQQRKIRNYIVDFRIEKRISGTKRLFEDWTLKNKA